MDHLLEPQPSYRLIALLPLGRGRSPIRKTVLRNLNVDDAEKYRVILTEELSRRTPASVEVEVKIELESGPDAAVWSPHWHA
jgi:hypothetical protein